MAYLNVLSHPTIPDPTIAYQRISHPTQFTVRKFSVSPQLSDEHYVAPLVTSVADKDRREWLHSPDKKLFRE
jgi:hypothetical protein